MTLKEIISAGGPVLIILALVSVYSVAVIWERFVIIRRAFAGLKKTKNFYSGFRGTVKELADRCSAHGGLADKFILNLINFRGDAEARRRFADKASERSCAPLSRNLTILATIGSVTPFVGLFGTVIGVIRAFKDLSVYAGAGPSVVAVGISEALVNTAAGLLVAIPAVIFYNYYAGKVNEFYGELSWLSERIANRYYKIDPAGDLSSDSD